MQKIADAVTVGRCNCGEISVYDHYGEGYSIGVLTPEGHLYSKCVPVVFDTKEAAIEAFKHINFTESSYRCFSSKFCNVTKYEQPNKF